VIEEVLSAYNAGPFGTPIRFRFIGATPDNPDALKGMGTYGAIKNPAGYIVGAINSSPKNLEDYGFAMERIVLRLTDLGLGTCWLGGLFSRGSFAQAIGSTTEEKIPAIVSVGIIGDRDQAKKSLIRRLAGSTNRRPWEELFFKGSFGKSLTQEETGVWHTVVEMVRWAPSAFNKQPWRIVKTETGWHFYLQRTKGYSSGLVARLVKMDDIQRLDSGIAMCHFELTARELGLPGNWTVDNPSIETPDGRTEYVASWR
jgi:hypothetical protein